MPQDWNATAAEPEATAAERLLLIAMPPGWRVLGRCRWGLAGPLGHPTGCHALAHPSFGVALIDVAPDATPNAEARLRRTLAAEGFTEACPGYLPVWHGRVEGGALRQLDGLVRDAFADLPPLTLSSRRGWPQAAAAALARDPAWQVPGHEPPPPPAAPLFELAPSPPRRRRLAVPVGLGLLLAFVLGVGTGVLLLGGRDIALVPPSEVALPAHGQLVARAMPEPAPAGVAEPAAVAPEPLAEAAPEPRVAAASEPPAEAPAAALPPEPAPAPAALPEPSAAAVLAPDRSEPPAALPGAEDAELPLPPAAPPRHAARPAPRPMQIDSACRQAVFRFSQGATLSWSEQAHLRNGCATRR